MIRVFHLITGLDTGGAEMALCRLLSALDPDRFQCRVASLIRPGAVADRIRELGVEVSGLGMRRGVPGPGGLIRLTRLLRDFRPHVLQTWLYHADLLGLAAGRLAGVRSVVWNIRCARMDLERYSPWTRLTRAACAALSGLPRAVLCNSQAAREYHLALGYRPREFLVFPNGFDTERFRPHAEARSAVRCELGISADAPVVGMAARWDHMKGHAVFCQAAGEVLRERPDVRFLLCGDGIDLANQDLFRLIREEGLEQAVRLLGRRDDLPRLFAAMDVHCLASLGESFPNVVGEAMACGVPCAVTEVGDAALLVGDTGAVACPGDPSALAGAVSRLLSLGQEERARLGEAARERIRSQYSLGAFADRYARLYEDLALEAGEGVR